jgi:hypothetical protein
MRTRARCDATSTRPTFPRRSPYDRRAGAVQLRIDIPRGQSRPRSGMWRNARCRGQARPIRSSSGSRRPAGIPPSAGRRGRSSPRARRAVCVCSLLSDVSQRVTSRVLLPPSTRPKLASGLLPGGHLSDTTTRSPLVHSQSRSSPVDAPTHPARPTAAAFCASPQARYSRAEATQDT